MNNISVGIMKSLKEEASFESKVDDFNTACCEWDFIQGWTAGDVTSPHIQGIDIDGNKISVTCELWDPDLDDYLSCDGGTFEAPEIIKLINETDFGFSIYEASRPIYQDIAALIDWDTVDKTLYDEAHKQKEELGIEPEV